MRLLLLTSSSLIHYHHHHQNQPQLIPQPPCSSDNKVTLYTAPTPNGQSLSSLKSSVCPTKSSVSLSWTKTSAKYTIQVKSPWFLEINPNGRIPAITHNGFNVFETSAILQYLQAEFDKENKFSFDPKASPKEYSEVSQWLFFLHGGVGPMQGQAGHFVLFAPEKIPYAQTRYLNETRRLYSVLETQLSKHYYLAGNKYTIADVKGFPWVRRSTALEIDLEKEFPKVKAWVDRIEARPAVQKGLQIPA